MQHKVVMISGYARAGKDTMANYLSAALKDRVWVDRYAFADELKRAANAALKSIGIKGVDFFREEDKVKYRDFLIQFGRTARSINKDVFADIVANGINENLKESKHLVEMGALGLQGTCNTVSIITDWRYENEYKVMASKFSPDHIIPVIVEKNGNTWSSEEERVSVQSIYDLGIPMIYSANNGDLDELQYHAGILANLVVATFEPPPRVIGE